MNGGILDKVLIAVNTDDKDDIKFLDEHLDNNNFYFKKTFNVSGNYKQLYTILDDDDLIFKMDDDIVFISNGTFEKMVVEYFKNEHFILSANVINHPFLSTTHLTLRAILPFYQSNEFSFKKSENKSEEIDKTLAWGIKDFRTWWNNGSLAAIAHESLLYNVYNNNIDVYDFKIYDFNTISYNRWSINFILSRGKKFNKINL